MWVWIQTQIWHRMCTTYTCSTIPSAPGTTCSTQTISLSSFSCEHFWSLEAADRKCLTKRWRMAASHLNTTLGIFRTLWCWTQSTLQRFRAREWRDTGQELMHLTERVQLRCQSYHRPFLAQMCQLDCLGPFADALLTLFPAALKLSHLLNGPGTPSLGPWGEDSSCSVLWTLKVEVVKNRDIFSWIVFSDRAV